MNAPIEWTAEALAALDWVGGAACAARLARHADVIRLERGQGVDLVEPVVVLQGEVEVLVSDRHAHCLGVGRVAGLDDIAGRVHRRLRALEASVVLTLRPAAFEDPALAACLLAAARSEIGHGAMQVQDELLNADEVVSSPGAELIPGPYTFEPMPVTYLVLEREPSAVRRLLPPGLAMIPGLEGRYMVLVSDIQSCRSDHPRGGGRRASYRELTVFIPCLGPGGRFGLYAPELFASATAPIMLGREVYGFPKRLGRVAIAPGGVSMACDGRLRLRARWSDEDPLTPAAFSEQLLATLRTGQPPASRGPGGPGGTVVRSGPARELAFAAMEGLGLMSRLGSASVFVRKRIATPCAEPRLTWAIDQLVRIPFAGTGMKHPRRLDSLRVDLDPMASLGGHALAGWAVEFGFCFGEGIVVRDYLADGRTQWRRWWERAS